jgi:hypothetical protein
MDNDTDVRILAARLEERLKASDMATKLAADALEAWKASANEWRTTLQDRDARYITRAEAIAMLVVGLTILGMILKYAK